MAQGTPLSSLEVLQKLCIKLGTEVELVRFRCYTFHSLTRNLKVGPGKGTLNKLPRKCRRSQSLGTMALGLL